MGHTNLWRFLFCFLSHQISLESILNPAMQRGTPEGVNLTVEGAPLLGFLEILGLAPSSFTIYSIMVAESYSESPITAFILRPSCSLTKLNWERTTLVPPTLAGRVISTRGNSDTASFII